MIVGISSDFAVRCRSPSFRSASVFWALKLALSNVRDRSIFWSMIICPVLRLFGYFSSMSETLSIRELYSGRWLDFKTALASCGPVAQVFAGAREEAREKRFLAPLLIAPREKLPDRG